MSQIFIYPGQLAAMANSSIIKTILGSCVGVALWDQNSKVGGLCHYLLPEGAGAAAKSGRYGDFAIHDLLRQCLALGAKKESIVAQVFGGGAVVDSLSSSNMAIGERNIACADSILKSLAIPVTRRSVGGTKGRRITLDTATGDVVEEVQGEKTELNRAGIAATVPLALTKILIVDDSATIRNILKNVFERSKKVVVVGTAIDPYDAREKILALKPDVITLDIEMPRMNGIAFLEKLMEHHPMPVVVVSSLAAQGAAAERALELGAIEFVHKPSQFDPMVLSDLAEQLIPKVIAAASIKPGKVKLPSKPAETTSTPTIQRSSSAPISLVVIGGNGGAANALESIISKLAPDTPPVVAAISTVSGFADAWIQKQKVSKKLPVQVELAVQDTILKMGHVYVVSDTHAKIQSEGGRLKLTHYKAPPSGGQRPSADILFSSASEACGSGLIGVMLSGYGQDGVNGLTVIRESGGWTICQAPDDCPFNFNVVAALNDGVVDEVATGFDIAQRIYSRRSTALG